MLPNMRYMEHHTTAPEDPTLPPVGSTWNFPVSISGGFWTWFLRILGVALAFAGGIALGYAATAPETGSTVGNWWVLIALVVCGALLALLLRSWWAIVILPVVFSVGIFVGTVIEGGGFDFQTWLPTAAEAAFFVVVFCDLPLMLGIALGTPFGGAIERRVRR